MHARVVVALLASAAALPGHADVLRQVETPRYTIAISVDYSSGKGARVIHDRNHRVVRVEPLPGRPQSNRSEFERAVAIIRTTTALEDAMRSGAVAEGGFIVDGPPGQPPHHRYIQIRLLSSDRRKLLRVVLVDLSRGVVASVRLTFA
jgi:hypothetical protein